MKRKTTYIIGAGASSELGFPVGRALTDEISKMLRFKIDHFDKITSGNPCLIGALRLVPHPTSESRFNPAYLAQTANDIGQNMGLAPSIDNYLEAKKDKLGYSEVGKLAIASAILGHERKSGLWYDPRKGDITQPNFAALPDNWLSALFRILSAQKDLGGFLTALSATRFITFNYDRVIERFFLEAVKSYFDLNLVDAEKYMKDHLNVVHVYGSLGPIWGGEIIPFGASEDSSTVHSASRNIRTFSEGIAEENEMDLAKNWCEDTDNIIFMGFAFLPLNLRALRPVYRLQERRVYATSYGLSEDNAGIAKTILLNTWFRGMDEMLDFRLKKCGDMISDIAGYLAEDDLFD